ncbi:MAG: acetyltransferase [Flavobacteriaceae bacterium]|nr:acetyltransferase [Flavobacteriaceae bacterium]
MTCIYGASGHGKVIASILTLQGVSIDYFLDDYSRLDNLCGITVKCCDDVEELKKSELIIGIGDNGIRKKIALELETIFINAIHPKAILDPSVLIGEGNIVGANAVVNIDTIIGDHCIVNTGAIIEHDCTLDSFVHISPNATLLGGVQVGEGTHIGAGATILPEIRIGKWVTIGAGAVVIKNIPDYAVVVGSPGKIIKYNIK